MFEHSVKVPRTYKLSANILRKVLNEGASLKTLLYQDKAKHFRTNVVYALVSEALKRNHVLDNLFTKTELLTKETRLDPYLAKILTVELLYGKKSLPGKSKPEITIATYKEQFEKCSEIPIEEVKKALPKPRYIRINTNVLTTSDAIRSFQDEGFNFIRCTSGTYNDYLLQIQGLGEYDFTQDYHIKTVFVFAHGTKFHGHELLESGQILLQDKATALAPHLLAPPPGAVVLDMCAAPGMKTSQVAAMLKNQGKVYAVEMNAERFKLLEEFVEKTKSSCVEVINKDILKIRRGEYPDVEYILLDPSCSGSGMDISAYQYKDEGRLAKLTSLQEKLLKHAMYAFPKAKRIVYSTCSVFPEENERVVTNVVTHCKRMKWRVQNVKELLKDNWNNFGSGIYGSIGYRCLYSVPGEDLTTGFFLSVLDRDPKDFEKLEERENGDISEKVPKDRKKSNKIKSTTGDVSSKNENETQHDENNIIVESHSKKKKKRKIEKNKYEADADIPKVNDETSSIHQKKRKDKKTTAIHDSTEIEEKSMNEVTKNKNKKKSQVVPNATEAQNNIALEENISNGELRKKKKKRKNNDDLGVVEVIPRKKKKLEKEITETEDGIKEKIGDHSNMKRKKNKKQIDTASTVVE